MTEPAQGGVEEPTWTIGDLAGAFGLTLRTIRFYEDQGLLNPRRVGQTRVFGHRDRARLELICRAKRLGFSIAEIKEFLDLYAVDGAQVEQMRFAHQRVRTRAAALRQQLEDVRKTLGELEEIDRAIVEHLRRHGAEPSGEGGNGP